MTNHNVYINDDMGGDYRYSTAEQIARADIIVEPPIVIGEEFNSTVLGSSPLGVDLEHVISTQDMTVLRARVGGGRDISERHWAFVGLVARIDRLANDPKEAIKMSEETPFIERTNLVFGYTGNI